MRTGFIGLLVAVAAAGCGRKTEPARGSVMPVAPRISRETAEDVPRTRRPADGGHRLIWLGLDGLDWELLDRLAADGTMPNWKRLAAEGATARLRSFVPLISPILWTTAATGVAPDIHRVLDFQETDPKTGAKVPISGFSRAVPAVWNLASAAGRKVGVVGWWATHPAEEVNGFFVSDHASPILFDRLPLAGAAFPASIGPGLAQIQRRDGAVTDAEVASFFDGAPSDVAAARAKGAGLTDPIVALDRIVSSTRVSHRVARDLYDRERPDLLALYLEGTDEIGHVFAADTPPKLACTPDADFARYQNVVRRYYALVDRLLGQWMRRAAEDGATLLVHSDHGFKWSEDRPCALASGNWATAAFWHRLDGVAAAWGARVTPSVTRGDASIFDVAPTILELLDVPSGPRMSGRPMRFAFPTLAPPARRAIPEVAVRRVAAEAMSAAEANEYAKKLMALGYLSGGETRPLAPSGGDRPGMTEGAWNNLGLYLRDTANKPGDARAAFQESLALRPHYYSPMYNLAVLSRSDGHTKEAEEWLIKSLGETGSDPAPALGAWVREYEAAGKHAAALSLVSHGARVFPENERVARELAMARYRSRDCEGAEEALSRYASSTRDPRTLNDLALFATCRKNREAVVRFLERSLALDPNQPEVARTLSRVRGAG